MVEKRNVLDQGQGAEHSSMRGVQIGPVKEWLFIAGTVPRDSQNTVVGKGDIKKQIEKVFENLACILEEGRMTFNDLVQLNVYLTDESYRTWYDEWAEKTFKDNPIAQTILIVRGLHDPDVLVEIDGIACLSD